MKFKVVMGVLGTLLWLLGLLMLIPLFVSIYYGESPQTFAIAFTITMVAGTIFAFRIEPAKEDWDLKEGFMIVAFGWLAAAIFGAIPFVLEGMTPINAFFESMSGFTTTGATVMVDIESHSRGLLFWRSLTQWLGGMGIIMLFIAILPKLGIAGRQMFRAEVPGPQEDKLRPRIRETAKILWMVYVAISVVECVALYLAGLNLYDSVTHTFTTMACGGFSPYADSIAAFNSPVVEGIICFFMFLAGANFALHYRMFYVDKGSLLKDDEFKFYTLIIAIATLSLTLLLFKDHVYGLGTSFRYSVFQVLSILTTTGYATVDFNQWADSGRMLLFIVMFFGGCAGSTGGGIKIVRILLLLRYANRELFKAVHPKAVRIIRFNGKAVSDDVMHSIVSFVIIYFILFFISSGLLTMMGMDVFSSLSASIATLGNIGPAFNLFGPMANYNLLPFMGKLLLVLNMWIGRLEVFTVMVMLTSAFWKK